MNEDKEGAASRSLLVISLVVACTVIIAFSGSAYRVDDTLFIWAAKQIRQSPLDPYGLEINWKGFPQGMAENNQNPPLVSYYMALVSLFFGFSERAVHIAFMLPAAICLFAVYRISSMLTGRGGIAALFTAVSPAFMVSSMTVMSDLLMTAFWCLGCMFWISGVNEEKRWSLALGAFFSGAAALTKYFGISCPILLSAYSILKRKPLPVLWMLVPAGMVLLWSGLSESLYGRSHILQAFLYRDSSEGATTAARLAGKAIEAVAFTGGCSLFPALLVLRRGAKAKRVVTAALFIFAAVSAVAMFGDSLWLIKGRLHANEAAMLGAFFSVGALALAKCASEAVRERSAESLMLLLWVWGTAVFAAFLNWTVAGRNILPMVPALSVVVSGSLKERAAQAKPGRGLGTWIVLVVTLAASVALTWSDSMLANTARRAAAEINMDFGGITGQKWFQGHWGFQYYMEALGGKPVNYNDPGWKKDDILIIPLRNSYIEKPDLGVVKPFKTYTYLPSPCISTMNTGVGAGFYSTGFGPLPFSAGAVRPEYYVVYIDRGTGGPSPARATSKN